MRQFVTGILTLLALTIFHPQASHAWLIFHKPEYRGKIIDAETKKPLEGVVVVATYSTIDIIGGPGGPSSSEIGAREALTDENGIFVIPSYTTIMNPIAREQPTGLIIFKPGYASLPGSELDKVLPFGKCLNKDPFYCPPECCMDEIFFTKPIGSKEEIIKNPRTRETITITYGIVELTRLDTWKERRRAYSIGRPEFNLPILYKMIEAEDEWLWSHKGWRRTQR